MLVKFKDILDQVRITVHGVKYSELHALIYIHKKTQLSFRPTATVVGCERILLHLVDVFPLPHRSYKKTPSLSIVCQKIYYMHVCILVSEISRSSKCVLYLYMTRFGNL